MNRLERMWGEGILLALGAAAAGALLLAPAAGAVTAAVAITNLNAQRAANGIPAGITVDPALSDGCAKHNNYMHVNGDIATHEEVATNPGYTPEGQRAGLASLVAHNIPLPWDTVDHNPFETAPIHMAEALDPSLLVSGWDEAFNFICLTTTAPPRRPEPAPRIYTYPGPGKRIYASERAEEEPFVPGELVGIPRGTVTGPYIYVLADGIDRFAAIKARITAASLTRAGRHGRKVKLRHVDSATPQLTPFISPGGMLIPVKPLKKGTYKASVTVKAGKKKLKKRWKFTAA